MTTRQVAFRLKSDGKAEVKRDLGEIGQAGKSAYGAIAQGADEASRASDRQMAKYRQMAEAARQAGRAADEQRKFNAILGVDRQSKSAQDSAAAFAGGGRGRGMSNMTRQTMIYTGSDIVASLGSGISPAMIALQQGPQVLQAIAMEGGNAIGVMTRLALSIGLPVTAIALLTGAWLSNKEASRQMQIAVSGIGAASGASAAELMALAEANREAGQVSGGAAREMAGAYAETGRIGKDVIGGLIALTRTYATVTRQDAKAATQELAVAFADPAKGAEVLNAKIGFLDDGTYRYVQTLLEQNRVTDAQLVLSDALSRKLTSAASNVSVLGAAWDSVKLKAMGAWDAMGRAIDRAISGGSALEQLNALQIKRANTVAGLNVGPNLVQAELAKIDAEMATLRSQLASQQRSAQSTRENILAQDARAVRDRINPGAGRLGGLRTDAAKLQEAIDKGLMSDGAKATKDLAALRREIKAVEAGYSSASAQAAALTREGRSAATEGRKAAREAAREAEEALRNAERLTDLKLRDRLNIARLQDNKFLVEELETEVRLRALINDYENAGVAAAKARLIAQQQIGAETRAEYETRRKLLTETPQGFESTEDLQRRLASLRIEANDNEAAAQTMKGAYMSAFDRVADRLASGGQAWGTWKDTAREAIQDIIGDLVRLAAINPLRNMLFGTSEPTLGSGGIFGALFGGKGGGGSSSFAPLQEGSVPKGLPNIFGKLGEIFSGGGFKMYANGTNYHPGGWAWAGERGPELLRLPGATQVFDANRSRAMAGGGAPSIYITVNAQGAGPREVDLIRTEMARLKAELPTIIVTTTNDARARRMAA
ncbi:phage tail length tape measure family protein [Phenylobacterium sp.]|uniref:phage tail length tape measure family protein n=1 Tax=Phenylobacterium sp. TaxID=1871053 RepID=UPI002734D515|nr:phage tail length tape measure family protein [Phenylobacterium sp.]MDP3853150.1 phage tail length tape measure family protein [Phenylobacterium sp.]